MDLGPGAAAGGMEIDTWSTVAIYQRLIVVGAMKKLWEDLTVFYGNGLIVGGFNGFYGNGSIVGGFNGVYGKRVIVGGFNGFKGKRVIVGGFNGFLWERINCGRLI